MIYDEFDFSSFSKGKNKEEYDFINLLGKEYQAFYNCSKTKKGYSGVAIFTKYKPIYPKNTLKPMSEKNTA